MNSIFHKQEMTNTKHQPQRRLWLDQMFLYKVGLSNILNSLN
jgi:hypothetical protein